MAETSTSQFDPSQVEKHLASLLKLIPENANDTSMDDRQRQRLYKKVQQAAERLADFAVSLDLIALPPLIYNPADPATFAESIGNKLLVQDPIPLTSVKERKFYGSGVYALYYRGDFEAYRPIRNTATPIYVGSAMPDKTKTGASPRSQGTRLCVRLREHADSISEARNLDLSDFDCRYLVVASGWEIAAEAHLIKLFRPVWNKEVGVCRGIGKHGDSSTTRDNLRSDWDTLHPGRPWADDARPNDRNATRIKADVAKHYLTHPPRH